MLRGSGCGWLSRKNGKIMFRYYDAAGSERSKVLGSDTLSDSKAWIRVGDLGFDKLVGRPHGHQYSLQELCDLYLTYGKTKTGTDKAESTKALDRQLVRDYVAKKFGSRIAIHIEPIEFQSHLETISAGVRPHVRNLLSAVYRHAQKMSWIPRTQESNPISWVSVSTVSDYEAVVISPEQSWSVAELLPLFVRILVITIAATACRVSEALALKWSDIEWDRNQIRIRRSWVRGKRNAGGRIGKAKSKASRAPVPMHPVVAAVLKEWKQETMYAKDDDWVFPSFKLGGHQPPSASTMVSDYIRPTAVKLGIIDDECPRFGFHNFRHSLSTFLIREGYDPRVVQRMLRQSDPGMTMHYTHMDEERLGAQERFLEKMVPPEARIQ